MTTKTIIIILLVGLLTRNICDGSELNTDETQAKMFAQRASETLFNLFDIMLVEIDKEDIDYWKMIHYLRNISKMIFEDSHKFNVDSFKDKELKFAFLQLRDYVEATVIDEVKLYDLLFAFVDLKLLLEDEVIEEYGHRKVKLQYDPDVIDIIISSSNPDEVQYYWTEWRKLTGNWSENMNLLLQAVRDVANIGDKTPLEVWIEHYSVVNMEKLMTDITPLYVELHAFIRDRLQKKYGNSIMKPDGLIPMHLFEQVIEQAWTNQSIIEDSFPKSSLPPVEDSVKKRLKAINLYESADRFYEKLGFERYPSSIWNDSIQPIDDPENHDVCDDAVFYASPHVELEYCKDTSFKDFLEAYEQMGTLYYAKEMKGLPAYFFQTYNLVEAVGKAVTLSASTHEHLKMFGIIVDFKLTEDVENNRLFRMALQKILRIPLHFVHIKVMVDLLSQKVELKDLNVNYWQLMKKYAGVGPPPNHSTDTLDLPYNFFWQQNDMLAQFDMEFLSYKMYKKFCELDGDYPKGPLHLCDIQGSKEAGDALRKMMKLGSSKPYADVLGSMFPDSPYVTSESLLEYYDPIKNLIAKMNIKRGWSH